MPTEHTIREERFLLTSPSGVSALVSCHGASLVSLVAPDRYGSFADIVLGFDKCEDYADRPDLYFGATIGRVAQRISQAAFELDGEEYSLEKNLGEHSLHGGGTRSFDRVRWAASPRSGSDGQAVTFAHHSPHLEEGYPGNVDTKVTYLLRPEGLLEIQYEATTDARTPINLTNHTYWNLAGHDASTILDHEVTIAADRYTPTDEDLIPTGEILPVDGTPLDLRSPIILKDRIDELSRTDGFDHNLVLDKNRPEQIPAARVRHPGSGRVLEITTGQPCLQLYSGNLMSPAVGKFGVHYPRRSGMCLEPGGYPDAVNNPSFESIIVNAGETYTEKTCYRLTTDTDGQ